MHIDPGNHGRWEDWEAPQSVGHTKERPRSIDSDIQGLELFEQAALEEGWTIVEKTELATYSNLVKNRLSDFLDTFAAEVAPSGTAVSENDDLPEIPRYRVTLLSAARDNEGNRHLLVTFRETSTGRLLWPRCDLTQPDYGTFCGLVFELDDLEEDFEGNGDYTFMMIMSDVVFECEMKRFLSSDSKGVIGESANWQLSEHSLDGLQLDSLMQAAQPTKGSHSFLIRNGNGYDVLLEIKRAPILCITTTVFPKSESLEFPSFPCASNHTRAVISFIENNKLARRTLYNLTEMPELERLLNFLAEQSLREKFNYDWPSDWTVRLEALASLPDGKNVSLLASIVDKDHNYVIPSPINSAPTVSSDFAGFTLWHAEKISRLFSVARRFPFPISEWGEKAFRVHAKLVSSDLIVEGVYLQPLGFNRQIIQLSLEPGASIFYGDLLSRIEEDLIGKGFDTSNLKIQTVQTAPYEDEYSVVFLMLIRHNMGYHIMDLSYFSQGLAYVGMRQNTFIPLREAGTEKEN